jgi:hypothetical protein
VPLLHRRADRWSSHFLTRTRRAPFNLLAATMLSLLWAPRLEASPSTYASPAVHFLGASTGDRFGSAVDCSAPTGSSAPRSLIAVGAPGAVDGSSLGATGSVHIIDPHEASGMETVQILHSPSPQRGAEFGKALSFILDFNNDGISDLAVAQPNSSGGAVFFFQSSLSTATGRVSFTFCGSTTSVPYFGEVLTPLRTPNLGGPTLLIGSPRSSPSSTHAVSISSSGSSCSVVEHPAFLFEVADSSRFGSALAFVANHTTSQDGLPEMVVGAPRQGGAQNLSGSLQMAYSDHGSAPLQPTATPASASTSTSYAAGTPAQGLSLFASGASTDLLGSALVGSEQSPIFAASAPGALNGAGRVSLYSTDGSSLCSFSPSVNDSAIAFGQAIAGLGTAFPHLTNGSDFTIASYHSEDETGGSVTLSGMNTTTSTCTQSLVRLNNCVRQNTQQQGFALGGGSRCSIIAQGAPRAFLLVGSPGFSSSLGRVDLYAEGIGMHDAPQACPNSTSAIQTPIIDPTPSPPPSPTPKSRDEQPTLTPTPPSQRQGAIGAYPDYDDLPEPKVEVTRGTRVAITLPVISPQFESSSYSRAYQKLLKAGFSPSQATQALEKISVTYIVTIEPLATAKEGGMMKKSFARSAKSPTKVRLRSRKNRVSTRLLPSTSYSVSYIVEFAVMKPKRLVLGTTKKSAPTRFRVN